MKRIWVLLMILGLLYPIHATSSPQDLTVKLTAKGLIISATDETYIEALNNMENSLEIVFRDIDDENTIIMNNSQQTLFEGVYTYEDSTKGYYTYIAPSTLQNYPFITDKRYTIEINVSSYPTIILDHTSFNIMQFITLLDTLSTNQQNQLSKEDLKQLDTTVQSLENIKINLQMTDESFDISGAIAAIIATNQQGTMDPCILEYEDNEEIHVEISVKNNECLDETYQDETYRVLNVLQDFDLQFKRTINDLQTQIITHLPILIRMDINKNELPNNKIYKILKTDANGNKSYSDLYFSEDSYYFYTDTLFNFKLVEVESVHKIELPKNENTNDYAPIYIPSNETLNTEEISEDITEIVEENQPDLPQNLPTSSQTSDNNVVLGSSNIFIVSFIFMVFIKKQIYYLN